MTFEMRSEFHRELDKLDISMSALLGLLPGAITSAVALVIGEEGHVAGGDLVRWRDLVEDLYSEVGNTCEIILARQQPVASDLRFMLGCLRILPELNDSVELIADVASHTPGDLGSLLPPEVRAGLFRLGEAVASRWSEVGRLWSDKSDPTSAAPTGPDPIPAMAEELSAQVLDLPLSAVPPIAVVSQSLVWMDRHASTALALAARLHPQHARPA